MQAVPGPRAGRRSKRLLRAAAAVLASVSLCAVASVAAAPSPATAATKGVSIEVAPADGGILTPDGTLAVSVSIRNESEAPVAAGEVNVYINRTLLDSRADLAEWLDPEEELQRRPGALVGTSATSMVLPGTTLLLPPVTIPVETLGFPSSSSSFGPRGLAARLVSDNVTIAEGRGTAVWYPGDSTARSRVTVIAPLTVPGTTEGVLDADVLTGFTAPGGLLTRQLDALARHPEVAIGVDPRIVLSIRALGAAAPGSAVDWLARLDSLTNEIFPLAYADADVALQPQAGADLLLQPTSVDFALDAANFTGPLPQAGADQTLSADSGSGDEGGPEQPPVPAESDGTEPAPSPSSTEPGTVPSLEQLLAWDYTRDAIAWPAPNTMTAEALPVFTASGVRTTILDSENVSLSSDGTPDATATAGDEDVLISDSVLADLLGSAISAGSEAEFRDALSRLTAELAAITREQPGESRTLLAALDRSAPTGQRLIEILDALAAVPWGGTATLDSALDAEPTSIEIADRPEAGDRVAAMGAVFTGEAEMSAFSVILERPDLLTGEQRMNVLALLSVAWLDSRPGWFTAAHDQQAQAAEILGSVHVGESSVLQVVGDNVQLPVRIENELDQPATVLVSGRTINARAEVEGSVTVTVPANASQRATLPVRSVSNGPSTILVTLTSVDGTVAVDGVTPIEVEIRAGWETIAVLVAAIGVLFLFGFGIVRSLRKRRREREAAERSAAERRADHAHDVDHIDDPDDPIENRTALGNGARNEREAG
jgi:Family of unknown function (DUF6049)